MIARNSNSPRAPSLARESRQSTSTDCRDSYNARPRNRDVLPVLDRPGFVERFKGKFAQGDPNECWLWKGSINKKGYGVIGVSKKSVMYIASRVAYALATGQEPGQLSVCHTCDNPPCVNPAHLWLGTTSDNNRDKFEKGRATSLRGEDAPGSKLTEAQVLEIFQSQEILSSVAARFGVSETCITSIRQGKSWAWLTTGLTRPARFRSARAHERYTRAAAMYAEGKNRREIGDAIGVAHDYVKLLLRRGPRGQSV